MLAKIVGYRVNYSFGLVLAFLRVVLRDYPNLLQQVCLVTPDTQNPNISEGFLGFYDNSGNTQP